MVSPGWDGAGDFSHQSGPGTSRTTIYDAAVDDEVVRPITPLSTPERVSTGLKSPGREGRK
jgi:hypothetical protein